MVMSEKAYRYMLSRYAPAPPERGGALGMRDGTVCAYVHDLSAPVADRAVYVPDTAFLNARIEAWTEEGVSFCGLVHSHPAGQTGLSSGDLTYIERLFAENGGLGRLYFPLVTDGRDVTVWAVAAENGRLSIRRERLTVV